MKAKLVLTDGTCFEGTAFGALHKHVIGEAVFSTAMTGYPELITDPSFTNQILALTNPEIGNYGITLNDLESNKAHISGLVVRELSPIVSNWRADMSLEEYLVRQQVPGIYGIDTRALVRHLREQGAMMSVLSTDESLTNSDLIRLAQEAPSMQGQDLAFKVSTKESYIYKEQDSKSNDKKFKIIALDFGLKKNMLRLLARRGCEIKVMPAWTTAEEILAENPDGLFLTNGPGDPSAVTYAIDNVKKLIGKLPMFGICLGYQILALALGERTYKLKYGHRGGNQPVYFKDKDLNKVLITAQNHGFALEKDFKNSKNKNLALNINISDETAESFESKENYLLGVQYHPEAAPGPHDAQFYFDDFCQMMKDFNRTKKETQMVSEIHV